MSAWVRPWFLALLCLCCWQAHLVAAEPVVDYSRGRQLLDTYLRTETQKLANACLADIKTHADWEKRRPELRRQFLEMIGLWPLPPRTDLKATITGRVDRDRFLVHKLHFQSMPGLYVTANLYIPRFTVFPAPTVLYLCGHSPTVVGGVPYGNKVSYQHHPIWFAEHGYVCLILDTLELGEMAGVHHGTFDGNQWWWQTLGYTPAGIECWNALRALDYLESRPEVDRQRLGVTGRSGGGATSWWVAAADDRPKCIVPVAGIADLYSHVVEGSKPRFAKGVISGHCDCMYFVNTYRWDFPMVAALCAPRPLLLGNSDADDIFPVPGYRRLADKVRRIYDLYHAGDKFALLETAGPHKDTPELRLGAYRWLNRWLKGETSGDVKEGEPRRFTPAELKVFTHLPDDAGNATVQETFLKAAHPALPQVSAVAREWWSGQRSQWLGALQQKVFSGWPDSATPPAVKPAGDIKSNGLRVRAVDYTSQEGVELRIWLMTAEAVEKPSLVVLTAVDEEGWHDWLQELAPAHQALVPPGTRLKTDDSKLLQNRQVLDFNQWAFATVAARGIGPSCWAKAGSFEDRQIRRRFPLLGQTLDGMRVWDVRRALAVLRGMDDLKGAPLWLQGHGEMAGVVLYAGTFEPEVARIDLWQPPVSHAQAPIFLNVRRFLDLPQAVALAFPRQVRIYARDEAEAKQWAWPVELQKALGQEFVKIRLCSD